MTELKRFILLFVTPELDIVTSAVGCSFRKLKAEVLLLDHWKTNAAESLLQIMNADTLCV